MQTTRAWAGPRAVCVSELLSGSCAEERVAFIAPNYDDYCMHLIQPKVLDRLAEHAECFRRARPFRHQVIDDFLDRGFCEQLLADFPAFDARYAKNEVGAVGEKAVRMDMPSLSPAFARLDRYLQSREFLSTIEQLTGIPELLYDADYVGGGTHENRHGQGLDIHVDFNVLPARGWHRRLNLIVYLNPEWEESWGGALELHADPWAGSGPFLKLAPAFNRCAIFETNEVSWHGFERIELPEDRRHLTRKSIAVYLYTATRPAQETAPSHGTIYVPAGLPDDVRPDSVLSHEQWLQLRRRFAQMRSQLKFLYQRELQASAQLEAAARALSEAQAAVALPLLGSATSSGVSGYWPDGWMTVRLAAELYLARGVTEVSFELWAPPQLAREQVLVITFGDDNTTATIAPGQRVRLRAPVHARAGATLALRMDASESFLPTTGDVRRLALKLIAIEMTHDDSKSDWLLSAAVSARKAIRVATETIRTAHPNGHFYSPVCDPADLKKRSEELWPPSPALPIGIDFQPARHEQILREWFPRHRPAYDYPESGASDDELTHFYTRNSQFSWLDARALFVLLCELKPKRIIEVGSGYSSLLMADVNRRFLGGSVDIRCIEPYPRPFLTRGLPGIAEVIVERVERVPLATFESLQSGDVLFIDSSHVSKTGSDVNTLFFDVLPRLRQGVIVHVHDIFLPSEYLQEWVLEENRSWNEQYLLRAMLMHSEAFEVLFACNYAALHHAEALAVALGVPPEKAFGGGSFWIRRR